MKTNQFSPVRWAIAFLLPTLPVICAAALYTYLVDPLWQWPHPHHLQRWHRAFNERLQKTNYLASRDVSIDTLMLGSSRSTYFRTEWLRSDNGFNYATNDGRPFEFATRIEYAKKRSATPIKLIFVEASDIAMVTYIYDYRFEEPSYYIANAEDEGKKIKNLFNPSALGRALDTRRKPAWDHYLIDSLGKPEYKEDHNDPQNADKRERLVDRRVKFFASRRYNTPYDAAYPQYLADIHKAAGEAETIIYTPPVAWQLMARFVEMNMLDGYEKNLRALVAEFGKVYHFFYPNPMVMDNATFADADHPTVAAAEQIISIILRLRSGEIEEDTEHGGILLTEENIEELLPRFRGEFQSLELRAKSLELSKG